MEEDIFFQPSCPCVNDTTSSESLLTPHCECPRDEHDIVIHKEVCLLYKNEQMLYHPEPNAVCLCEVPPREGLPEGYCPCCSCAVDRCMCRKAGHEALEEWRNNQSVAGTMPAVLEAGHPLMQKFQETLQQFLQKENALAEEEIINLRDELKLSKLAYDQDLESIYRSDHDTNKQRLLIEEYEANIAKINAERKAAEERAQATTDKYKKNKEKLDQDTANEREANQEMESLSMLCRQLEEWREETESDLTISHRMSDKMRAEKKALADEKRQLDMFIYGLSNEVWKLESQLETFRKQMEIKRVEMEKVNDKVTAYAAELEDLDLDKRRLVSLWNSVLVNIQQRDKVFDSVRLDYRDLQENYKTLLTNLVITKKITEEEMNRGKEIAMNKDKLVYDVNNLTKLFDAEDFKRLELEKEIMELNESIEMTEKDKQLLKVENLSKRNILKVTQKEYDRNVELKVKLENEILSNIQECLLNDKAVESMANGIKKMREWSRKQEITLTEMENNHAKMMFDIEVYRNKQIQHKQMLEKSQAELKKREKEIDALEEKYQQGMLEITRKQRDYDLNYRKYVALKEIFDSKTPQEREIDELEQHIKALRERTEEMQCEWLRLQGHVVKLSSQHQKLITDVNLIKKQIQICEQKTMRIQAECENIVCEKARVDRSLRDLRGRLEFLQRTRTEATERNDNAHRTNVATTFEYTANLKDAESEIIQLQDEIEAFEKEKMNLTQDLDKIQREALIWQRKGIQAVELKKNMAAAKSAAGEIGQMRAEIHRMTVRREQLRKIGEKLSDDLAQCVTRRETAVEKSRATAAVEKAHGPSSTTSQSQYRHKLRLAKCDVARVTKDINDTKSNIEYMDREQQRLENEVASLTEWNLKLEERVAQLMREYSVTERRKHWLLERVVRSQRLSSELARAVKKQSLKIKKPKTTVIAEYAQSKALNETLRCVTDTLTREYPYLEDKFAIVMNTLNIYVPEDVPMLSEEDCLCDEESPKSESIPDYSIICPEKPLE